MKTLIAQPMPISLTGICQIPGDKSISHRALLLAALADGVSQIEGFLDSEDCRATLQALTMLGVQTEGPIQRRVVVHGVGLQGFDAPRDTIDCGNSATTLRLLAGILAAQPFESELTGDESLLKRPMSGITQPLAQMGANIRGTEQQTAPLLLRPCERLRGIEYHLPQSSAQIKSSVLLAGIMAEGETTVIDSGVSRDHTERMLTYAGYPIKKAEHRISLFGGHRLKPLDIVVPADFSSAFFFITAATLLPGSHLMLKRVGVNPTRLGGLKILQLMGANITLLNRRLLGDEPIADILVSHASLDGVEIPQEQVSLAIDEFPAIFIAASMARGRTILRGASVLREKESDRITVMAAGLSNCGIDVETFEDGVMIEGGRLMTGTIDAADDHRVAMAFAVAGWVGDGQVTVLRTENVVTSMPNFVGLARSLGLPIVEREHD